MENLDTEEIIEALNEKFPVDAYVSQMITHSGAEGAKQSITHILPNVKIEITNEITGNDDSDNAITFKMQDFEQIVSILKAYYHAKRSLANCVAKYFIENDLVENKDLYMTFYLEPME